MPELSDDRLAAILASVGDHLVVPRPTADPLTTGVSPPNGSAAGPPDPLPATATATEDDAGAATADGSGDPDRAAPHVTHPEPRRRQDDAAAGVERGRGQGEADADDSAAPVSGPGPGSGDERSRRGDDDGGTVPGGPGGPGAQARTWWRPRTRRRGRPDRRGPSGPTGRRGGPGAGGAGTEAERRAAQLHAARAPRRRMVVAAVVVAAVGVVGTVVAPVREAVAGWLGIGSTEIVRVGVGEGDPGDLPYLGDDLVPVERAAAERRLGAPLPETGETELGPAPVLALPLEGGVIMAWDDGATTLWVRGDDRPAGEIVSKLLTIDDRLERLDGLGEDAAIVEGPHVLGTPLRRLAAGTVLAWVDDRFEYRLESDLDPEQMVEIARALDTP